MQNKQFPLIYFGAVDPYKDNAPIQIFKFNSMTQQDKVIKVFLDLLSKGEVTTLDVKLKLRADYPTEYWTQDFISVVLADYQDENDTQVGFRDNGHYRTYYKIMVTAYIGTPAKTSYSYTTQSGAVITHDNQYTLEGILKALGEVVHWSESKKCFIPVREMQENHLLNTIWKKTDGFSPKEFANFIQTSPYVSELVSRYPDNPFI